MSFTSRAEEAFSHIKAWVEAKVKAEVAEAEYRRNHIELKHVQPLRDAADASEAKVKDVMGVTAPPADTPAPASSPQDASGDHGGTQQE